MTKRKLYWLGALIMTPVMVLAVIYHQSALLFSLGTVLLGLICVVVNLFVVIYAGRSWRETDGGKAVMYSVASLAVLADLSLATNFLPDGWEWRAAVRLFLFGGIFIAHLHLLWIMLMAPLTARAEMARDRSNQ